MANVNLLRKLIREEVRSAFQEELADILKEVLKEKKAPKNIQESKSFEKPKVPGTLNTSIKRPIAPNLGVGNPLSSLLAETAQSMVTDDYDSLSFSSNDAQGFGHIQSKEVPVVESVDHMMATARASNNLDAIQINAVPDFTGLMQKLKDKGAI